MTVTFAGMAIDGGKHPATISVLNPSEDTAITVTATILGQYMTLDGTIPPRAIWTRIIRSLTGSAQVVAAELLCSGRCIAAVVLSNAGDSGAALIPQAVCR